jgi:hypothetical protein
MSVLGQLSYFGGNPFGAAAFRVLSKARWPSSTNASCASCRSRSSKNLSATILPPADEVVGFQACCNNAASKLGCSLQETAMSVLRCLFEMASQGGVLNG